MDIPPIKVTLSIIPRRPFGAGQPFAPLRVLDKDFWKRVLVGSRKFGDPRLEVVAISASKGAAQELEKALEPQIKPPVVEE